MWYILLRINRLTKIRMRISASETGLLRRLYSLAFRTGCSQSVVMHTYTYITRLALRFRGGSLHSCPQGSEGVSALKWSR